MTEKDKSNTTTGVLILLINNATKLAPFLADQDKKYRFNVHFGVETDTQDSTGRVVNVRPCEPLEEREIKIACAAFIGEVEQMVPRFSAVRIGGQRLYRLARQGVEITPPSRKVEIKNLYFCHLSWPEVTFEVTCSKGTYVRSLGVDLARHLNCCGHVSKLRRLASGGFDLSQAVSLEEFRQLVDKNELGLRLITPAQALVEYPDLRVSHRVAKNIRQGGTLNSEEYFHSDSSLVGPYRVLDPDNNLVAVVSESVKGVNESPERGSDFKTLRVFGSIS